MLEHFTKGGLRQNQHLLDVAISLANDAERVRFADYCHFRCGTKWEAEWARRT